MPLEAEAAHERELKWFVNGKVLGQGPGGRAALVDACTGTHEILVSDDQGLSSHRLLVVRRRP